MSVEKAPSDLDLALWLAGVIGRPAMDGTERMVMKVIPGNPPTKSRHRVGRGGHVYHDSRAKAAERRTGSFIREAINGRPFTGNVAVGCIFFRKDSYRQDVDNMLKHVCDAANKIAWKDDSQVTAVMGMVELDPVNPRTVLVFTSHDSSLRRGTDDVVDCAGCGRPIERRAKRKYCSDECRGAPRGPLAVPVACAGCGQPFKRFTATQKHCSTDCVPRRGREKSPVSNRSRCADCGKQLSHNRGGRCRECWRASPRRTPGGNDAQSQ